jgi:flavodoxin
MAEVLVAYYSRTGTTERLARALADRLGAEFDRIETPTSYAGPIGFAKGIWHSLRGVSPPIRRGLDPRRFRVVVVCSPVWAGRLAGPPRTYIRQAGKIQRLCGAAVSGAGGRQERFFREMERLGGQDGIPRLSLAQRQVAGGGFEGLLDAFVETIRGGYTAAA